MAEKQELIDNRRDWSDLPTDIIYLIAKKLPDIFEFVRFRAVCKSWRSSAPLSDPPPQMPWLLEFSGCSFDSFIFPRKKLRFYSITSDKTVTISVKKNKWFRGASCHYLPSYNDCEDVISLFNPLTRKTIVYPPIGNITHKMVSPWMVWTGTSPICDQNILFVECDCNWKNEIGQWVFYDAQHEKWNKEDRSIYNFCYCRGKLFSTTSDFQTKVTDISSKKLLHTIPPPEDGYRAIWPDWMRRSYLVESCGEILAVSWFQDWNKTTVEESKINIHRLDFRGEHGQSRWIRISDIGDQIIFLEVRASFSITASSSTTAFKSGYIYLIEPNDRGLYMYNIIAGTVEKVPCPFKQCTWFLPGLN